MNEIIIAKANLADRDNLANTFQHFKEKKVMLNRAECYLTHKNAILAKKGNEIVGKSLWYVKEDPNDGVIELEELYVMKEFRGKGIGSELIKSTINAARNYFENIEVEPRRIFLYTSRENPNAIKLYEKFGFEMVANLGSLFSDNGVDLFYVLDLTKKRKKITNFYELKCL